jgi:hypothetical protein
MGSVPPRFTGPAGEHYVLYRLHAQGLMAALAPRNAPTVDVLVLTQRATPARVPSGPPLAA